MRANLPAGAYGGPNSAVSGWFGHLASTTAYLTGKPATFLLALLIVIVWGVTGPIFHYSDTWQLVINTGTTIVTFLMVFLIQNTQTRDTTALQMKLDELIMATKGASNSIIGIEDATEDEINEAKEGSRRRSHE
jgi:low affinity Fe/Cu permease